MSTSRRKAWRNLMVAAINAAIERDVLSLAPGKDQGAIIFGFTIADRPALCSVSDVGWDEVSIHAAYLPTADADHWIRASNAGFLAGQAFASGWLERRKGRYLQTSPELFNCRQDLVAELAALPIEPTGYQDRGPLIL